MASTLLHKKKTMMNKKSMILALYTQVQEAENKSEKRKRNDNNNVHTQSHPTLCDPMDCSPPDSSVHGIPQVGILE